MLFPVGTFLLTDYLTIPSGVRLTGTGYSSVLLFKKSSGLAYGLLLSSVNDVEIDHLNIQGSTSTPTLELGVYIDACTNIRFRDNWLSGAGWYQSGGTYWAGISIEGGSDIHITDNDISNNCGSGGTPVAHGTYDIVNNEFSGSDNSRIFVERNRIHNSNAEISVQLFDSSNGRVANNWIDQNNCISSVPSSGGYGICIYNTHLASAPCAYHVVTGNTVQNCAGSGIYLQGCIYTVCTDNNIYNVAQQETVTPARAPAEFY